jgi:hypothetical protein
VKEFDDAFAKHASARLLAQNRPVPQLDEFVESDVLTDRDIISDGTLKPCVFDATNSKSHHSDLQQSLSGLFTKTKVVSNNFLRHNLPVDDKANVPIPDHVFHKNFVSYLTLAYQFHFSVIITPDMIFYTLLSELAEVIKHEPKAFEKLFTSTPGQKQKLVVPTMDPNVLDLEAIVAKLREKLPSDADMFTARFSTTNFDSRLAMNAAFADAMSPYYEYGNTYCGIPRIRVMGTKADWVELEDKIKRWRSLLCAVAPNLKRWLQSAQETIFDIYTQRSPAFWNGMFSIDNCSSGHTDVVEGWIGRIYRKCYSSRRRGELHHSTGTDFYNFDTHISTVRWTFDGDDGREQKFVLYTGLLYSKILRSDDPLDQKYPFLEPHFAHAVQSEDIPPTGAEYDRYLEGLPAEDGDFLMRHKEFMEKPVILETGEEKTTQRRKLVIAKFKSFAQRAKDPNFASVSLKFGFELSRDFGRDYDFGRDDDYSAKKEADVDPMFVELGNAIFEFLQQSAGLSSVDFTDHQLGFLGQMIVSALAGHGSLKKLIFDDKLVKTNHDELVALFNHPECRIEELDLTLRNPASVVIADSIKSSSAPIVRIKYDIFPLPNYCCAPLIHFQPVFSPQRNGSSFQNDQCILVPRVQHLFPVVASRRKGHRIC